MKKELYCHPAFKGLSEKELIDVYNIASIKNFESGVCIFEEGTGAHAAFLILKGAVKILKQEDGKLREIVIFKQGDLIGEMAFVKHNLRTATAVAIEPTTVISLNDSSLNTLKPPTQLTIYKNLVTIASERIYYVISQENNLSLKNKYITDYISNSILTKKEEYATCTMIQKIIKSIPRLPMYAGKLTAMLNDEKVSVSEVVELVRQDPSLVASILKTVNSAYYGLLNKIEDFQRAVLLLGFSQVYQLVFDSSLRGIMPNTPEFKELQFHSYMISLIGFEISQLLRIERPIKVCTIGLLHDIGRSVILLLKRQYKDSTFFLDLMDYTIVGSLLLRAWNISPDICLSIEYQDFPIFAPPEKIPEEIRGDVAIQYIAHLSYDYMRGIPEKELPITFLDEYIHFLNFTDTSLPRIVSNHILPILNKKIESFPDHVRKFLEQIPLSLAMKNDNKIFQDVDLSVTLPA
ncbi:MAG: HDOD domain-containing protein [bacterium]